MTPDLFGLEAEARIAQSGIRKIFTPHQPIESTRLFFGRQSEVHRIVQSILTPGQHVLLYGDRGVGKSSLANVSRELLLQRLVGGSALVRRCDSTSDFPRIGEWLLRSLGVELGGTTTVTETSTTSEGVLNAALVKGSMTAQERASESRLVPRHGLSPADVAGSIAGLEGLLILDEFDAMAGATDRHKVAEFIKQLSDSGSQFKVLVVGIAESSADLLAGHPSVQRSLREIRLGRMTDGEATELLTKNAGAAKIEFADPVVAEIVNLSAGYPHFVQLLGLKSAELAIGDGRREVTPVDLTYALNLSVDDAEEALRTSYGSAVRSYQTETYRVIVESAALLRGPEFTAKDLRDAVSARLGRDVQQGEMNNHFGRLVSGDGSAILTREAKGVYRFTDPRMRSYVRIAQRAAETASV